jgi:lactate dehydrogenase-like 2-hydroxyacid dehydrogenase
MTELLMPVRLSDAIVENLQSRYTLHRLWEAKDRDALINEITPRVDAIVTAGAILAHGMSFSTDAAFIARFPKLKLIANHGVGYDTIDAQAAAARGIMVTNTPDVLTDETADTAFGLVLNTVREFPAAERYLRAGEWAKGPYRLTASLRNKTMGILGLGRIGKAIAKRGEAFGLKIAYCGRHRQADVAYDFYATPQSLAAACDILVLAAPGGAQTRHIVDAAVLQALGPKGFLINIARGSVVDEAALIAALRAGTIAGAGLDVFAQEPHFSPAFLDLPNTVLLPHVGSASVETREAMENLLIANIDAFAVGRPVLTPVDECRLARPLAQ